MVADGLTVALLPRNFSNAPGHDQIRRVADAPAQSDASSSSDIPGSRREAADRWSSAAGKVGGCVNGTHLHDFESGGWNSFQVVVIASPTAVGKLR